MSSQFKNLHPYVSQRIVSMFEALARKHSRLVHTLHQSGDLEGKFKIFTVDILAMLKVFFFRS